MVFSEVCFGQRLTLTLAFHAVVMVFVEGRFAQRLTLTLTVFRTVEVANSRLLEMSSSGTMLWTPSHLVTSLIESLLDLHRLKMSAEFVSTSSSCQ